MLGLPEVALGAIAAVAAAVIAALISLLGLIISKEQKISEFRQEWIDSLRKEISSLISHANAIHGGSVARPPSVAAAWKDVREDFVGINEAAANIRLRLNSKEPPSCAVLSTIDKIEAILSPGKTIDYEELIKRNREMLG
jgi:hypothetical protein